MKIERAIEEQFTQVGAALSAQKGVNLLEEIAWPRDVEERFFACGESSLPEIQYTTDRDNLESRVAELDALERSIDGDHPILDWLRACVRTRIDGALMLLARGSRSFYERSCAIHGSARSTFFGGALRNVDLADHLLDRLRVHGWDDARDPPEQDIDARAMKDLLTARIAARTPRMDIEVKLDKHITAKVIAGSSRVRVREGATFAPWEAEGLWHHEIETHALTAQNGASQARASFLRSGGPRTTRAQEGLAIFAELYTRTLAVQRLERLAVRVKLVDMAEEGASFLDLYRYLRDRGAPRRDAYLDAQRICRGGLCAGGAPFTKDAVYLAGLLEVYAFLSAVMRGGFRDEIELVVCGRIALEDIAVLTELRAAGLLSRPRYLPAWLLEWHTLLPYFAFTSFMDGIDLGPVQRHFSDLIRRAEAARPRSQ